VVADCKHQTLAQMSFCQPASDCPVVRT